MEIWKIYLVAGLFFAGIVYYRYYYKTKDYD